MNHFYFSYNEFQLPRRFGTSEPTLLQRAPLFPREADILKLKSVWGNVKLTSHCCFFQLLENVPHTVHLTLYSLLSNVLNRLKPGMGLNEQEENVSKTERFTYHWSRFNMQRRNRHSSQVIYCNFFKVSLWISAIPAQNLQHIFSLELCV